MTPQEEAVTVIQAKDGSPADLVATIGRLISLTPRTAGAVDAQDMCATVRSICESALDRWNTRTSSSDAATLDGWQDIASAKEGERYLGAFEAPLRPRGRWLMTGVGRVENGRFVDHLGVWPAVSRVLLIHSPAAPTPGEAS